MYTEAGWVHQEEVVLWSEPATLSHFENYLPSLPPWPIGHLDLPSSHWRGFDKTVIPRGGVLGAPVWTLALTPALGKGASSWTLSWDLEVLRIPLVFLTSPSAH